MSGQLKEKNPQKGDEDKGWILQPDVHFNSSSQVDEKVTLELNLIIGENQFKFEVTKVPFL